MTIDVLCVGDAATDLFIRLSGSYVQAAHHGRGAFLELPFGGKMPFEYALTVEAGGNAANAAVGMARLGLSTALAAHLGNDQVGREMVAALHHEAVDTHLVHLDPGRSTNRNFVLWCGQDRTILVRHELYDYHWPHLRPREIPAWIYLSSVGSDAPAYYEEIADWLKSEPAVRLVFQPGTFQIKLGVAPLHALYARTELLVCNREEAAAIGGAHPSRMDELLESLHALGPRTVVVTDGPDGAYASDQACRYAVPTYPDPGPPKERTGAGDAFASALVAAMAKGLPLPEALAWGPINAMSVVQGIGSQAGLLDEAAVRSHLDAAPDTYRISTW
jgi:ribokinase